MDAQHLIETRLSLFFEHPDREALIREYFQRRPTVTVTVYDPHSTGALYKYFTDGAREGEARHTTDGVVDAIDLSTLASIAEDRTDDFTVKFVILPEPMESSQIIKTCNHAGQRPITLNELLCINMRTAFSCFFLPALGSTVIHGGKACHPAFWDQPYPDLGVCGEQSLRRSRRRTATRELHAAPTSITFPRLTIIPVVDLT